MTKLMVMDIIDMERVEAGGEIVEFIVQQDQSVGGWLTVGEGSHTVHKNIGSDLQGIVSCSPATPHPGYIWSCWAHIAYLQIKIFLCMQINGNKNSDQPVFTFNFTL